MKTIVLVVALALTGMACSSLAELEIPPPPPPPGDWSNFSTLKVQGSDCPVIEGTFLEPPSIYRSGVDPDAVPKENTDLYSGYIPFHRADRKEWANDGKGPSRASFVIRQPDATQFYFSYLNEQKNTLVEYHFQQGEGDFECQEGRMEFPKLKSIGMIEGSSVNFQIQNVLLKDEQGALVIQSTGGPYRGIPSKAGEGFMFEFFRYLPE